MAIFVLGQSDDYETAPQTFYREFDTEEEAFQFMKEHHNQWHYGREYVITGYFSGELKEFVPENKK